MNPAFRILVLALVAGGLVAAGAAVIHNTPSASAQGRGDAWLGVSLQDLDRDLRDALDLERGATGAVVGSVVPDSPADDAGLRRLDLIIRIGTDDIEDMDEAIDHIRDYDAGDEVEVTVLRRGRERTYTVELGSREDSRFVETPRVRRGAPGVVILGDDEDDKVRNRLRIHRGDRHGRHSIHHGEEAGFLGVESMELNDQLAEYFGAEDGGVLITKVVEDSPAEEAGLAAGDVILSVAGREVDSSSRLRRAVRRYDPDEDVEVVVLRRGERRTFTVTLADVRDFGGGAVIAPNVFGFDFDPDFDFDFDFEGLDGSHIYKFDHDELREHMHELREHLKDIRQEIREEIRGEVQGNLRHELRKGMEEARRALDEARREVRNAVDEVYYD